MKQHQFYFLFAAVYLAPRVHEDLGLILACATTAMAFWALWMGE
jgi:hypothetical protein